MSRIATLRRFARYILIAAVAVAGVSLDACGKHQVSDQTSPQVSDQTSPQSSDQTTPSEERPFSGNSFWNAPLPVDAAIDPGSAGMVKGLVNEVQAELARHYGPGISTKQYSAPVYTVGPGQPTVRVTLDRYLPEMQKAIDAVPIPRDARPAAGTDGHMVVWQPDTDSMWEFWKMEMRSDGWHTAEAGAMHHVSTNPGYYTPAAWPGAQPWWGATATGLPLLGGLMRIDELQRGRIGHALAMAIPHPRAGVWSWPATHGDGDSADARSLPEGARLRLKPAIDLASMSLPRMTRMLAQAAQTYGIVIRDYGGAVAFYGEDPSPLGHNPYPSLYEGRNPDELLSEFPWAGLEVLKLSLDGPTVTP